MVGLILSVLAAAAAPEIGRFVVRDRAPGVAEDIAYLLRYAQSRAVVSRRALRLQAEGVPVFYWLEQQKGEPDGAVPGMETVFEPLPGRTGRRVEVPSGVEVNPLPVSLVLAPDGSIRGGSVTICGQQQCYRLETRVQRGQVLVMDIPRQDAGLTAEGGAP